MMDDYADPLPLPTAPTLPSAPGATRPQEDGFGSIAKLLPLLAIAAKTGGRTGVAAFLQGVQQSRARRQQQAHQQAMDTRQQRLDQGNEDYRQQQLMLQANQQQLTREQQTAQARQQFITALQGVDNAAAGQALVDFYGASGLIPKDELTGYVARTLTPDVTRTRKIQNKWKGLSAEERQLAQQHGASLTIDGDVIPFPQWSQVIGSMVDPATGAYPVKEPPETSTQKTDVLLDGQPAFAFFDPKKQKFFDAQGTDVTARVKPMPPASVMYPQDQASGLSPRAQAQVGAQARTFESLPVVKNTQKISEAVAFVNALDLNTKNPADDQALIYAFAKAMDPDSVVREGEYATVQKYSQSWLESFGFNAQRVLSNSEFLTTQARANLKRTILARFRAAKPQYDAVRRSYVTKINKITGQPDGEDWLTDYGAAFPTESGKTDTPTAEAVRPVGAPPPTGNPYRGR